MGMSKLQLCPLEVQISPGHVVEVSNHYACKVSADFEAEQRHTLGLHWRLLGKSSPGYYDKVGLCTTICPLYYILNQLLNKFGIAGSISRNRDVVNRMGRFCKSDSFHQLAKDYSSPTFDSIIVVI